MIRLSPILLVAAAQAMVAVAPVRRTFPRVPRPAPEPERSFAFAMQAGYWAHFDPVVGHSAWPFAGARTIAELAREAARRLVLRDDAVVGALALLSSHRGSGGDYRQLGIVTRVVGRSPLPRVHAAVCEVLWAVRSAGDTVRLERAEQGFDAARGDRFVHWWEVARDDGRARTLRVAA